MVDPVKPDLDNAPITVFADRLGKAIADGSIYEGGWEIHVRRYDIPVPGSDVHTSIELHGPNGFYSSLDTNTYNGKDTNLLSKTAQAMGVPYVTGTEMRMTTDHERPGNWVVKDENLVRSTIIDQGDGPPMLLQYLRMAEQAKEFNTSGADYALYAEDTKTKQRSNSNAGPMQILENVGYDVRHEGPDKNVDLRAEKFTVNGTEYTAPGASHQIRSLFPIEQKGFFEKFDGNPAAIIENLTLRRIATDMMQSLHPDVIARNVDDQSGPMAGPPTIGPATLKP